MSRPLRLQFPGALSHVSARGNARQAIFFDDCDRERFLDFLGITVRRFSWTLLTYALMSNHYHLVVELNDETLSIGEQWLNGKYAQWFNRRHRRVGHLLQGRFHSPLVDGEAYRLELLRYVVLNPVRANMVERPEDYEWSSYRTIAGETEAPEWLAADRALSYFSDEPSIAREAYKRFVAEGIGSTKCPWDDLVGQLYLGREEWIDDVRTRVESVPRSSDHPMSQRVLNRPSMPEIISAVAEVFSVDEDCVRHGRGGTARMVAAWIASYEAHLANTRIAAALRLRSSSRVAQLIQQCEDALSKHTNLRETLDRCVATLRRKN